MGQGQIIKLLLAFAPGEQWLLWASAMINYKLYENGSVRLK